MKRIVWIAAIAAAIFLTPFRSRDAAKLIPVRSLCMYAQDGLCVVGTDGGLFGAGADPALAIADLERTAPGTLVLSTARQLVVSDSAEVYLRPLLELDALHPGTSLYRSDAPVDVSDAAGFLNRRGSGVTVSRVRAAYFSDEPIDLPRLAGSEGRYYFY